MMGGRVISKLGFQAHLDFAHLLLFCLLIGGCGIFIKILSAHAGAVNTNGYRILLRLSLFNELQSM